MIKFIKGSFVTLLLLSGFLLMSGTAYGQTDDFRYYYYHGYKYGSEGLVNPLRLIINGGFGILQMDNRVNNLDAVDYKTGVKNLWYNLRNPIKPIKEEGVGHFIQTQVIPFSFDEKEAYYWPNYTLHLLGGGMSYRMMTEWFHYHGYSHPKLYSIATLSVYHFLNEVVENSSFEGYNTDPIADIYIFNPLGVLLFSSDKVARFFSETLNFNDWSYQPSYNPIKNTIENNGQNFVMKLWLNKVKKLGIFYHFGTHGEIGLSFRRDDGRCISFGAGLVANELVDQSERADLRELTADLVLTAGIFYDLNNSLLASLFYSKKLDQKVRLNIYPGLVKIKSFSPGFYLGLNQQNQPSAGLTLRVLPIGIAKNF